MYVFQYAPLSMHLACQLFKIKKNHKKNTRMIKRKQKNPPIRTNMHQFGSQIDSISTHLVSIKLPMISTDKFATVNEIRN